ncbi:MAG: flavin reductase family protein [Pyrinomonadaceae bacterium]|nr:flavin reductase family protein [Pyrinomonadaceae bacterium]
MEKIEFDIEKMAHNESYRLLSSLVVPRPIAFVTTISANGIVNAAPFSFFNMMGSEPPIVVLGVTRDDGRGFGLKDTARNILENGEFVINLVGENIINEMNIGAIDFPPEASEIENSNLHLFDSKKIKVPCIAESAANFECRHVVTNEIGRNRVTIGEIVHLHLGAEFYDAETRHVLTEKIGIVGRMHGGANYTKTSQIFALSRITFADWQQKNGKDK